MSISILHSRIARLACLISLLGLVFYFATSGGNELATPVQTTTHSQVLALQQRITADSLPIKFMPSIEWRPLKSKAIVTLLTSDTKGFDGYYMMALLQTYTLLHDEKTAINLSDDVEWVIVVTEKIPKQKRALLLAMGARLLVMNSLFIKGISDKSPQWQYCYTKLYLFRLENIYKQILYVDSDIFFRSSPLPLFNFIEEATVKTPEKYYFGARQDWGLAKGTFNAGLFLFSPSIKHYDMLMSLIPRTESYASWMMEQGLLNWYFGKGGPSGVIWSPLPEHYNVQFVNKRPQKEIDEAIGFHAKFWWEDVSPHTEVYLEWRAALLKFKKYQLEYYGGSDVPDIPDTFGKLANVIADFEKIK